MARVAPLFVGACLALAAPPSFAQTQVQDEKAYFSTWPETPYEVFHPDLPEPAEASLTRSFRSLQMGRLDEGSSPDGLVLQEIDGVPRAAILTNPGQFNAVWPLGQVTDATLLRGACPDGRDAVLCLSTGGGLELRSVFVDAQGVESIVTQSVRSTAPWQSAKRVWVVAQSATVQDVIVLAADGTTALRLEFASGTFQDEAPFVLPYGLSSIEALDYDGTGDGHLVYFSDPYVGIATWNGTLIGYMNAAPDANDWTVPAGGRRFVTVLPGVANSTSAENRDLVAVHLWDGATQAFHVFTFNSGYANWFEVGPPTDLANRSWAGTATDYDDDGLSDLILCSGSSSTGNVLLRTGSIPALVRASTPGSALSFTAGPSLPSQGARAIAAADIDRDGDLDLLTLVDALSGPYTRPGVQTFLSSEVAGRRLELAVVADSFKKVAENAYQVMVEWAPPEGGAPSPAPTHILFQGWIEQNTTVAFTTDIERVLRKEVTYTSVPGQTLVTFETDEPLDLEHCALHLHVGLITRSGGDITHFHPTELVYATAGDSAELCIGWRVNYELGQLGPGGGSCGDGCTIGNGGGNTSPGPGPQPRH